MRGIVGASTCEGAKGFLLRDSRGTWLFLRCDFGNLMGKVGDALSMFLASVSKK